MELQTVLRVTTSEPRDALQSERTCLSFIRFSTTLFVTSFGILINFKILSPNDEFKPIFNSTFSIVISFILLGSSIVLLVCSLINYLVTINNYKVHNIHNFGFNNNFNSVVMLCLIALLVALNICLLADGYMN